MYIWETKGVWASQSYIIYTHTYTCIYTVSDKMLKYLHKSEYGWYIVHNKHGNVGIPFPTMATYNQKCQEPQKGVTTTQEQGKKQEMPSV